MSTRMLALGHSELMAQHQDLGILPPRLTARQAQQRHGPGNNQEDQLQARKPMIIARPARPEPASHVLETGTSRHPEDICTGGTGFRHPVTIRRVRSPFGMILVSAASMARLVQDMRGLGFARRSTATSCRSASISRSLADEHRATSASQDSTVTSSR
jgi:hypothetical protein